MPATRRTQRTHPGLVAWAEATRACLALRRAGIRAAHPRLTAAGVERKLRAELDATRALKLDAYRRNA